MLQRLLLITLTLCSLSASAQWQQTGSKVRYVNGLGIPTKDTAAGVSADSSQIVIRPADSSLYVKYKRTWIRVGGGGGSIGGSGTTNYVPKFTASGFIGNSQIFDNGTGVGINTTSPINKFSIVGTGTGVLDFNTDATRCEIQSYNKPLAINRQGNNTLLNEGGGNVGIGTASPVTDLQISRAGSSTLRLTNTSNSTNLELGISTALGFVGTNTDNSFAINTNNAERVRITNTGNVGIGYTAPAANLSVSGTTLINTNTDNGVDKLQVSGSVTASGTLTAATIVKSGGTSLQFLMADGSTSLGGGGTLSGTTNYVPKFTSSSAIGNSQIIDNGTNLSLRTTASTYPVNINLGANSGMAFYQDGTIATIYGTNQNINSTAALQFLASQYIFAGTASGKITVNTSSDNGVDYLQVNGSISGIGFKQAYVTKTGAYTATNADYVIDCTSGTFTVTLPASSGRTGRILIIKNSGAGTITVDGNASETIDGATTVTLAVQYGTIQIMSDGTNWKTIAKF